MKITVSLIACLTIFLISGCSTDQTPVKSEPVIKDVYPGLGELIVNRDVNGLMSFTKHADSSVSDLAWRALSKSTFPVSKLSGDGNFTIRSLVDESVDEDEFGAWFALASQSDIPESELIRIRTAFDTGLLKPGGVCHFFFQKGDKNDLELLVQHPDLITSNAICAKAVGGILSRTKADHGLVDEVYKLAFETENDTIRRNLLYGFFRSQMNSPDPMLTRFFDIADFWLAFGVGRDAVTDQYMVRALGNGAATIVMAERNDEDLKKNIQLSVELARAIQFWNPMDIDPDLVKRLLKHPNSHVKTAVLQSLLQHNRVNPKLLSWIESEFIQKTRNDEVFIAAIELIQKSGISVKPYNEKLQYIKKSNPFFADRILTITRKFLAFDPFFEDLEQMVHNGSISALMAVRQLTDVWFSMEDFPGLESRVRSLVLDMLETENRSGLGAAEPLLLDDQLIPDRFYSQLEQFYFSYAESGYRQEMEMIERVLEERFPDRFESVDLITEKEFRIPDWNRLYSLGSNPYWILETNRGTIEIELDPLNAPFTVSAIDSLTSGGHYNGIAFHRVVRNFVIQGGSVGRNDGLGAPGFKLPTEPSFRSFERSKVGAASFGTDTEGSQYFIMHQWAPHLDSDYTIFGEVKRGMDVVDKIQLGETVKKASISIR